MGTTKKQTQQLENFFLFYVISKQAIEVNESHFSAEYQHLIV